jgi:CDP-diacylglycerol--glycerol-3-phosphate 3-phosphatidyltransferase
VSWTGAAGAGLAVAGGLILAWAGGGRTPVEVERGFDAFVAGWRGAHRLPDGSNPGGRVTLAWLRLPWWLGRRLAAAGVDPNRVTLAALWLALLAGWTATLGAGWAAAAGALTLAAGLADGVDGAVAVLARRTSAFGSVWDSTADRLADLAVVAGPVVLVAREAADPWAALAVAAGTAAALLALLLEYVRARAQAGGVEAAWTLVTPGERPVRVILLGVAGLLVGTAQLATPPLARAALLAAYPTALAVLAALEAAGVASLLALAARSGSPRTRPTP